MLEGSNQTGDYKQEIKEIGRMDPEMFNSKNY
jgi:hypothetical protein